MNRDGGARAAIIGAGLMGRWHAHAVTRIGGRITLVVDPNPVALAAVGSRYPDAKRLSELDPALISSMATAAHVCAPLETHASIITQLVEAEVPVLAEKPLAADVATTRELLALAQQHGVIVCPVHQFLFQDGVRDVLTWLPAMRPIRRVEFSTCTAGAEGHDPDGLDSLVAEILPHPLSLLAAVSGGPVADLRWHVVHPVAGEFRATATSGQLMMDIVISTHGRPTENVIRITGDNGSATVDLFHGFAVRHGPTVSRAAKISQPFMVSGRTLRTATANLVRRALRREPAYPGLRELVRAFYAAVARGTGSPIASEAVIDAARARDGLLAALSSQRT